MKSSIALNAFKWLVWRDMRALMRNFAATWFDNVVLLVAVVVFNSFVMPNFGLPANFGLYMLVSQTIACMTWIAINQSNALAVDLEGPQTITYELTLPLPAWCVYLKLVCVAALHSLLITTAVLPVGMLIAFGQLHLSWFTPLFFIVYPTACIMAASFGFMLAVWFKSLTSLNSFWMRWGSVLWMFSGLFAPWKIMLKTSVFMAAAALANPFLYVYEATHTPFMGQEQFLNIWFCLGMLILFCTLFLFVGWRLFKRRLDCV